MNWFGDTLKDAEKAILLKVKQDFKTFASIADFEVFTKDIVPFLILKK